jgi:hypothetical protein
MRFFPPHVREATQKWMFDPPCFALFSPTRAPAKREQTAPYPVTSSARRPLSGWPYSPVASTIKA